MQHSFELILVNDFTVSLDICIEHNWLESSISYLVLTITVWMLSYWSCIHPLIYRYWTFI